jgi:tetratricopeptide (TPR) repeat protein
LLGRFYVVTHQPDLAIRYLREALALSPFVDLAYQQLGHAYLQKRLYPEAIAAFGQAAALSGARDSAHLAYAHAVAGRRAEATRILRALLDGRRDRPLPAIDVALAYAGLGEDDEAFRWLDRGIAERAPFADHIKVMPGFDRVRADARFVSLIKRIGLSP